MDKKDHDTAKAHPIKNIDRLPFTIVAAMLGVAIVVAMRAWAISFPTLHFDHVIPLEVIKGMRLRDDFNTDWALAELPSHFKYAQLNFSSYLIAGRLWSGVLERIGINPSDTIEQLRLFSALCSVLVTCLLAAVSTKLGGRIAGVAAFLLAAILPILVQDAIYARPETFLALLTTIFVALLVLRSPDATLAAAFVFGVMLACKISSALLGPALALALLLGDEKTKILGPALIRRGVLSVTLAIAGFALGAPQALVDPAAFFGGIKALSAQYTSLHPPHGVIDPNPVKSFLWSSAYMLSTWGPGVILVSAFGLYSVFRRDPRTGAILSLVVVPTFLLFMVTAVFFERNLSHVTPALCIAFGLGVARLVALRPLVGSAVAVCSLLLPGILTTVLLVDVIPGNAKARVESDLAKLEARCNSKSRFVLPLSRDGFDDAVRELRASGQAGLIHTPIWRGDWDDRYFAALGELPDIKPVTLIRHPLDSLPTSTLQVYLGSGDRVFWYGDGDCRP